MLKLGICYRNQQDIFILFIASDEESPPPTKRRQNSKKNGKYYDKMDTSDDSVEQVSSMGLKFSLYM